MHKQKRPMRWMPKALLATLPAFLMAACASIDCTMTSAVSCHYALRGGVDTLYDSLTVLTLRPDSNDVVMLNRLSRFTSFSLPMSYAHDSDELLFVTKDTSGVTRTDTVIVFKTNTPHFESVDCAPRYFHTITNVTTTHHRIDSIAIANPNVDYDEKEDLLIYFHPGI